MAGFGGADAEADVVADAVATAVGAEVGAFGFGVSAAFGPHAAPRRRSAAT
jgi:hypothetical protein